jgi:hypothetical protein
VGGYQISLRLLQALIYPLSLPRRLRICWIVEKYPWSQIQGIIQIYKVQASFKVNLSNHFNWLKSDGVLVFIKI